MICKSQDLAAALAALTLSVAAFAHTKGDVTAGVPAEKVLSSIGLKPDASIADGDVKDIRFVHRRLNSLTDSSEPRIKRFSGAVAYSNIFRLKKKGIRGNDSVFLDLGGVEDLAEVTVNGKNPGVFWNAPFRVDITKAVRSGTNIIELKVINMWHNRLVGDVQPEAKERITYPQMEFFKPEGPLLPAGLLGPVKVIGTI